MAERDWQAEYEAAMATVATLQAKLDAALQAQTDAAATHAANVQTVREDVQNQLGAEVKRLKAAYLAEKQARELDAVRQRHAEELEQV